MISNEKFKSVCCILTNEKIFIIALYFDIRKDIYYCVVFWQTKRLLRCILTNEKIFIIKLYFDKRKDIYYCVVLDKRKEIFIIVSLQSIHPTNDSWLVLESTTLCAKNCTPNWWQERVPSQTIQQCMSLWRNQTQSCRRANHSNNHQSHYWNVNQLNDINNKKKNIEFEI